MFLQCFAFEKYHALRPNDTLEFIGLEEELKQIRQIVLTSDQFFISKGIQVFSNVVQRETQPKSNRGLLTEQNERMIDDTFAQA